ncbi:hypothetical protein PIB30_023643 [Stylosanthes scabra]|uniref:Uncharacterized protein n=1 Tax=Stylosanthes scabra TaxID=79078 RepID=A0ABU6R9Q5_9FABA|nr:hypothetical protein [Stylosanthes scabra]
MSCKLLNSVTDHNALNSHHCRNPELTVTGVAWLIGWALILQYTIGGSAVARGITPNLESWCWLIGRWNLEIGSRRIGYAQDQHHK